MTTEGRDAPFDRKGEALATQLFAVPDATYQCRWCQRFVSLSWDMIRRVRWESRNRESALWAVLSVGPDQKFTQTGWIECGECGIAKWGWEGRYPGGG